MSTNTTSTNDRLEADSQPPSPTKQDARKGTEKIGSVSPFVAVLPDPGVIARLANEFFVALPAATAPLDAHVPPVSPDEVDLRMPFGSASQTVVPDYPQKMFSTPTSPDDVGVPALLADTATSRPPVRPLNEADFQVIAASMIGLATLVPQTPTPVFPPASPPPTPGPSSSFFEERGPWAAALQFPPALEMFAFPGAPATPSSPAAAPPSGSDLAAAPLPLATASSSPSIPPARTNPWAAAPDFPNEVFSLPRVPGMSVPAVPEQGVPEQVASEQSDPEVIVSQPKLPVAAASPANTPLSIPAMPDAVPSPRLPDHTSDSMEAGRAVYGAVPTAFPSVTEMFSFPGVPGVQSPPSVPVLPSSAPASAPPEADLHPFSAAFTDTTAPPLPPGVPRPTFPNAPGRETPRLSPSLPNGAEAFEFRPDLTPRELGLAKRPLDPRLIRQDFPILQERVHGRQLIWLDNAATTQKPNAVIDRLSYFYQHENSNIHRAAHTLAARATDAYESAREKTRRFLNASSTREIIFVRGTTEGINLIAQAWGRRNVRKDDEIVITWLEHHANIVPWQQLCSEKSARLRVAPVNDRGEVILEEYEKLLGPRTRMVSFSQVSNALGTITPAREMVEMAHRHGARVLVDGAQAVSHMRVDVQALDCDFYVFSGHKIFGPTGIGALYGKLDVLETMPPWHGGGNMIVDVTFEKTVYQTPPARFEAGTGNIADAVGLGAALDYVEQVGMESISAYEHDLLIYGTEGLLTVPGLRLIGTAREKAGVLSFVLDDIRTEDVGAALNQEGIAVRSGHHCAQPILRRMGVESSVRPSLAFYNTREEIDALVASLLRLQVDLGHRKL
jgi:cysteine desulfurase/selenocysteine lyase